MNSQEALENRQLIQLYDNLAVYSDYLMRLTMDETDTLHDMREQNKLLKSSASGLTLIKKSNDIKGIFSLINR